MMVDRIPGDEYFYKSAKKKSKVEKVKKISSEESVVPPSKKLVPESTFGANLRALAENYVKGKVGEYNLTEKQLQLLDEYWGLDRLDQARQAESVIAGKKGGIELTAAGTKIKPEKVKGQKIGEMTIELPEEEKVEKVEETIPEKEEKAEKVEGQVIGEMTINLGEGEEPEETFKVVSKYLAGGFLDKKEAKLLSKAYGSDTKLLRIKRFKTMREMGWGPTKDEVEIEERIAVLEERGFTTPLGKKPPRQSLKIRRTRVPFEEREGELVIRVDEEGTAPVLDKEKIKQVSVSVEKMASGVAEGKSEKRKAKQVPVEEKLFEKLVPVFSEGFKKVFDTKIDELIETEVKKKVEAKSGLIDKSILSVSSQDVYLKGAEDERIRLLKEELLPKKYATLEERRKAGLITEEKERQLRLYASEGGKKGQKSKAAKLPLTEKPIQDQKSKAAKLPLTEKPVLETPSLPDKSSGVLVALPSEMSMNVKQEDTKATKLPSFHDQDTKVAKIPGLEKKAESPSQDTKATGMKATESPSYPVSPSSLDAKMILQNQELYFPKEKEIKERVVADIEEKEEPFQIKALEPFRIYSGNMIIPASKKSPKHLARMAGRKEAKIVFLSKEPTEYVADREWLLRYAEAPKQIKREMLYEAMDKSKPARPAKVVALKTAETVGRTVTLPFEVGYKALKEPQEALNVGKEGLKKIKESAFEAVKAAPYAGYKFVSSTAKETAKLMSQPRVRKWLHSPVGHALPIRRETDLKKVEMKRLRLYAER